MARPLRIVYPGAHYHVTSRGNARGEIFKNDQDRRAFLDILDVVVSQFQWICHAYCLMGNHYHLMIETPEANLSQGMRQLNGVYTQTYNRMRRRVGHLLQGRFKAILLEKDSHLLELCRYIVLNPVRARMVSGPGKWRWSSYKATAGTGKALRFLTTDWILNQFGKKRIAAQDTYRSFVQEGVKGSSPWEKLNGQIVLGGEAFVERCRNLVEGREGLEEVPKDQRQVGRPELKKIFQGANATRRDKKAYQAHVKYSYTLKEVADFLGVHYTTVSKGVKRIRRGK